MEESTVLEIYNLDTHQNPPSLKVTELKSGKLTLKKKVEFLVQNEQTNSETKRSYKDFLGFRAIMVDKWPGFIIPSIQDKVLFRQEVETLQDFLKKLSTDSYLCESEDLQLFLSPSSDYNKLSKSFRPNQYLDIARKYQMFSEYSVYHYDEALLDQEYSHLKKGLGVLQKFYNLCKACSENYRKSGTENARLVNFLSRLSERFRETKIEFNSRESFENPFSMLVEWGKNEIKDFECSCESLKRREEYITIRNKLEKIIASEQKLLEKALGSNKSKKISQMQNEINQTEAELKAVNFILKVISVRFIYKILPFFKETKGTMIDLVTRSFIKNCDQEFSNSITSMEAVQQRLPHN